MHEDYDNAVSRFIFQALQDNNNSTNPNLLTKKFIYAIFSHRGVCYEKIYCIVFMFCFAYLFGWLW